MTTTAVNHQPQPTAAAAARLKPRQMQEVQAPEMFQFTDQKPSIEGVYLGATRVNVKGSDGVRKETVQYMLQDLDGRRFTFLATYDLARKIQPAHVGHWMYVLYEGEDHEVKTQGSPMRKFRVAVGRDLEPGFVGGVASPITDEDIPF
jgi:hypothetical protein